VCRCLTSMVTPSDKYQELIAERDEARVDERAAWQRRDLHAAQEARDRLEQIEAALAKLRHPSGQGEK
jgi:hypothetical protein